MKIKGLPQGQIRGLFLLLVLAFLIYIGKSLNHSKTAGEISPIVPKSVGKAKSNTVVSTKNGARKPIAPIEINQADSAAFEALPSIGPATARRIIKYRTVIGGFKSMDQFKRVYGMDTLYPKIAQWVYLQPKVPLSGTQKLYPKSDTALPPTLTPKVAEKLKRSFSALDLNLADSAQLEALPMIGPKLAHRIIEYRNKLGYFYSVQQLKEVYGLRDTFYIVAAPYLFVAEDKTQLPHIYINEADAATLSKHPYVYPGLANRIIKYRQQHGDFHSVSDLELIYGVKAETWQKLAPYLNFR